MKKRKILFITFLIISLTAFVSYSVNNKVMNNQEVPDETSTDTVQTNPKIDIKVEKEYDDEGNIIRYDSSYTYIYTHPDGGAEELNIDSIFNEFRPYFFNHGFDIMHNPFNRFFDEDTLYQHHFFDQDFFMNHFNNEIFRMEDMMREMDSIRNLFLKELYPDYEPQLKLKPQKQKINGTLQI